MENKEDIKLVGEYGGDWIGAAFIIVMPFLIGKIVGTVYSLYIKK